MDTVRVISSSFSNRDGKVKGCTFSKFAIEPDTSALHFNKALGDVQTQTGTGSFTRFRIIRAEELLENLCLIFKADANSIIFYPEVHDMFRAFRIPLIRGRFCTHKDLPTFGGVFMGIADEVRKNLTHTQAIRPDLWKWHGELKFNALTLIIHLTLCRTEYIIHDLFYIGGLIVEAQTSSFDLGVVVEVRNESRHAFHIGTDRAQEVRLHFIDLSNGTCGK